MEKLRTLLIADRGEIAVRIIKTAKDLDIKTVSIYTKADAASIHVSLADEAVLLPGEDSEAYTSSDDIIRIAKELQADAVIPGYGFLSEHADFARAVTAAGIAWCGPSPEVIEAFGAKHTARELAEKAGVPVVPSTQGSVANEDEAVNESGNLGYPVMLKVTGDGGSMGMVMCEDAQEVRKGFKTVQSRGEPLFQDAGVFIERYYSACHHIEVQVFGNGQGDAIHFGERECSIQRRHQKVIEECPSPFVQKHVRLRRKLCDAATSLAQSIKYSSAGTVEYLVDDKTGDFFFLGMSTKLQMEHGITELCYDVDLVELMLKQADAQLAGHDGLSSAELDSLQPRSGPRGVAIQARVYAEDPARDHALSPGLLQKVEWEHLDGSRIDTSAITGSTISPHYDPLIAKVMNHAKTRTATIKGMDLLLSRSQICGPSTNLEFLAAIVKDERYKDGETMTNFLQSFVYTPNAISVLSPGTNTLVQDLPGRPTVGKGIPHSGAMDPVALSIANILVGNEAGKEGLEITLSGPELHFLGSAVVSLCGATMDANLDGDEFPMWSRKHIKTGQKLRIGKITNGGCRAYLAVYGGFPSIADYFGSKSTSPVITIGGQQGRALVPGDLLTIVSSRPQSLSGHPTIPQQLRPDYPSHWKLCAMPGPHGEDYFTSEDIETIYSTDWEISHDNSRNAIRLLGPTPKWARLDGKEGGVHPSNIVEYGCPLQGLNWVGDEPAILALDGPNVGGFVCSTTTVQADYWKLGQVKAGDTIQYVRVSLDDALALRKHVDTYLATLLRAVSSGAWDDVPRFVTTAPKESSNYGTAVIHDRAAEGRVPRVRYRQGGDQQLIISYADDTDHFDINNRVRVNFIEKAIISSSAPSWLKNNLYTTVGTCNNLTLHYNGSKLPRDQLLNHLIRLEDQLGDFTTARIPCRHLKLPIAFSSLAQDEANQRYQSTQRRYAPYLPSNFDFVTRNNAFTNEGLKQYFLTSDFLTVSIGLYCGSPYAIPTDPRKRLFSPKTNPSRVLTPEGTVGLEGGAIAIYPVDSLGGDMMCGRTIPCWDYFGWKAGFSPDEPHIFRDLDLIGFFEVSEHELEAHLTDFRRGKYEFQWDDVHFDMQEHNQLLKETETEVEDLRARQKKAQDEMLAADDESLAKCRGEAERKYRLEYGRGSFEWYVLHGASLESGQVDPHGVAAVLETVELEINVDVPEDIPGGKAKSEKSLVKPGETVESGTKLAVVKHSR
ncbi:hypothetical protein K431DRAFT_314827 [Polychaeton citri CBS 116435]|uniref:Urea carboxylase n=1 Tax=Polychaeton citri CBS 116435 TaxID=1314669 RepID=A0A9P4UJZ6_9PEZI|nr:hypothetical protein K431DRAFT_314827 [Polychaeton citri CBS 116435]